MKVFERRSTTFADQTTPARSRRVRVYEFGEPQFSIQECREKDLTLSGRSR